ncbi:hypothetical protein K431DRAFT_226024 [Polychaeton citri CBS 116435]|uniref:Uncharacterized protein n=1 Tax=Polychaeton citri CBS 116435 TaxID=1314669 RepID=A0A9P4Q506_9PEZI|nr:hypothetical protein K431DRAFT_226024 [Polychaeton citri CBS 116435]
MSAYHYGAPTHYLPNASAHNNHSNSGNHHSHHPSHGHHGRSRRGPRVSSQNTHRHSKPQRSPKDLPEAPVYSEYLLRLEAAKSFEFDDDELFCPFHLLTEDDLQSIHSSSSSDRGSLSSGSPDSSPLQHQAQPTPSFLLSSAPAFNPAGYTAAQHMKLHQPMAQRTRNAIPIVDPSTRSITSTASPPLSVSPARQVQHQYMPRRW